MSYIPLFILFILVAIVVVGTLMPKHEPVDTARREPVDTPRKEFKIPHIPRELMTASEKQFFKKLCVAGEPWVLIVAPQVAMSAIVDIPKKYNDNLKYRHKNRAGFGEYSHD